MNYTIEPLLSTDWEEVKNIYIEGIQSGMATFQTEAPDWNIWDHDHLDSCRFVIRCNKKLAGWIALSPTSNRPCYQGVVEVSIYLSKVYKGQGLGTALFKHLITASEKNGFWTLYSSIIRDNAASIALHKKVGFHEVGIREKIAQMPTGIWHDVVIMERRSALIGQNNYVYNK